ncbi:hypothetical protein CSUI_003887 [Cystoisospora suis]|uniref:Uncharacterized protein n=1 Tax=Cystoisospora suis TaxID=483139 RepID=A0A2C6L2K2_9APIC|nr:hypothetical protein CSUI_003887 [Cystoisospora suis]
MRDRAQEIQGLVDRYGDAERSRFSATTMATTGAPLRGEGARETGIDWSTWEKEINHKDLVQCMKSFYTSQMKIFDDAEASLRNLEKIKDLQRNPGLMKGWTLYDEAIKSCTKSVEKSEELLTNGARALWISFNNPPITRVDTNEWLDSDQYWQAFVEKHHFFSQYQPGVADPEASSEVEAVKSSWHTRMSKFNDRSDTPMLYSYVEDLCSWEFYDIHRRVFLEHMTYYLIRTGGDFRFFPELPPWQWLAHMEDLRFNFLSLAQHRRSEMQLKNLERERPLDFFPVDVDHDGEEYTQKFLQAETEIYQCMTARLMSNYMFLCDPYIPVQSLEALEEIKRIDNGKGKVYSLEGDKTGGGGEAKEEINALFYLPIQEARQLSRPMHAVHKLFNHLTLSSRGLNPVYAKLLETHAEILEQRGPHWLTAPGGGECLSQAFLRRLRTDDPAYSVYTEYFQEMYDKFSAEAKEVPANELSSRLSHIAQKAAESDAAYVLLLQGSANPEVASRAKEGAEKLKLLSKANLIKGHQKIVGDLLRAVDEDTGKGKEDLLNTLKSVK